MKIPTLLGAALVLLAAAGWPAARAGGPAPGARVDAVLVPGSGGPVDAVPAGLDRCCPHRLTRVGIVRTGGLTGTTPGRPGAPVLEACDACEDWEVCARELESVEASMQLMPLRNGVMRVFTAATPTGIRVVQIALARHYERMSALITAGEAAHLCASCRAMRGAAVSGKLSREIIKIDGGCITLTTSADPVVVTKIHAEAGITTPIRPKI
jgi:hypothetical protein